jgi:hypothetical protein
MSRLRLILASAALAALASACTSYLPVNDSGDTTAKAPPTPAAPVKGDTCGASSMQYLVGKPKEEAPAPVDPSKRRVYCSSCVVTMDYRPDRMDIVFDKDSGKITAVKCG